MSKTVKVELPELRALTPRNNSTQIAGEVKNYDPLEYFDKKNPFVKSTHIFQFSLNCSRRSSTGCRFKGSHS